MTKPIGILGGTFDPIHLGHIQLAMTAYKLCQLQEVRFIPCYQSPLKNLPITRGKDRLAMLELAIKNNPNFIVDDRELQKEGFSYTVDTLKAIRAEIGTTPLCLIMSQDAFAKFNLWHKWQEIMDLTHLIVANRPNSKSIQGEVETLLKKRQVTSADALQVTAGGNIFLLEMLPNYISATTIRELIEKGEDASHLVSASVWQFIIEHNLYKEKR